MIKHNKILSPCLTGIRNNNNDIIYLINLIIKLYFLQAGNYSDIIPIRSLLCSYKCFNSDNHNFYGVAFP